VAYSSQTLLEQAVGGASILVQLLDKNGDGTADAALITECLDRGDEEVNGKIQVAVQLPLTTVPERVKRAATDIACYWAFQIGTAGQGTPGDVRVRYEAAQKFLDDVAERRQTVGAVAKPPTDQQVTEVQVEPYVVGTSIRDSLKGLW